MELQLTLEERCRLLRWARATVEAAACSAPPPDIPAAELTPTLSAPHAVFVTLLKSGELRGCIGKMDFQRPLWRNLQEAATAAALEDPRFARVEQAELPELTLEVSVLEQPRPIASASEFNALRHGIIIEKGFASALLLPKVAQERGWDERQTLETVCWKAGLPADAWECPDARLQVFEALEFGEEHP